MFGVVQVVTDMVEFQKKRLEQKRRIMTKEILLLDEPVFSTGFALPLQEGSRSVEYPVRNASARLPYCCF